MCMSGNFGTENKFIHIERPIYKLLYVLLLIQKSILLLKWFTNISQKGQKNTINGDVANASHLLILVPVQSI